MGQYQYGHVTLWETHGWTGTTVFVDEQLEKPLHWKKPRMIFVCSMGDFWHKTVTNEMRSRVYDVVRKCKQHTFQFLTKRPENIDDFPDDLDNAWLGATAENQEMADKRIPILLDIPAAKRFVSCEPLLSEIDFREIEEERWFCKNCGRYMDSENTFAGCGYCGNADELESRYTINGLIDWVIVGAESGPNRRECKPEWIDSIVDQCKAAGVPCFVKQIHEDGKLVKMPSQYPQEYPK
jgi:protein gp37